MAVFLPSKRQNLSFAWLSLRVVDSPLWNHNAGRWAPPDSQNIETLNEPLPHARHCVCKKAFGKPNRSWCALGKFLFKGSLRGEMRRDAPSWSQFGLYYPASVLPKRGPAVVRKVRMVAGLEVPGYCVQRGPGNVGLAPLFCGCSLPEGPPPAPADRRRSWGKSPAPGAPLCGALGRGSQLSAWRAHHAARGEGCGWAPQGSTAFWLGITEAGVESQHGRGLQRRAWRG